MEVDAEKLLVLVEARPPLYTYQLKEHHNRDMVPDKLWEEIAVDLKRSVSDCKIKWNSLRNSYARQLREMKNTPSGAAGSKKKKWYLFEAMSFLKDFMGQHKKMKSNYAETSTLTEEDTNEDFIESIDALEDSNNSQHSIIPTPSSTPSITPNLNPPKRLRKESEAEPNLNPPKKLRKERAAELVAGPMIAFLKSKTGQNDEVINNSDLNVFKSLLPDMQKLSDKKRRQFKAQLLLSLNKFIDEEEYERGRSSSVISTPLASPASTESHVFNTERNMQEMPAISRAFTKSMFPSEFNEYGNY